MSKLPFKTAPKAPETVLVGDEAIGTLEIPKLYDLSPNERIYIREKMQGVPDLRVEAVKLAKAIARTTGQKLLDVYNALTRSDTEALGENLEEFINFQELMERASQQRELVTATAILRYRVCPDWTLEDSRDATQISPKLLVAVYEFAQKEEAGWVEAEEGEPITEELLGKSSQAPQIQTGQPFTGDVSTIGVTTPDSAPATLVASPVI